MLENAQKMMEKKKDGEELLDFHFYQREKEP